MHVPEVSRRFSQLVEDSVPVINIGLVRVKFPMIDDYTVFIQMKCMQIKFERAGAKLDPLIISRN